jgi:hypothetical protein
MQVHPEYDIETRTWFVPGYKQEAPTIRELLEKLSKSTRKPVTAKCYFSIGSRMPSINLGIKTIEDFMRKPDRSSMRAGITLPRFVKLQKIQEPTDNSENNAGESHINSVIPCSKGGHHCSFPACAQDCPERPGNVSPERRARVSARVNTILDMWFIGKSPKEIVEVVGGRQMLIARRTVYQARRAGDPRAIIRGNSRKK